MTEEHPIWWLLMAACIVWYTTIMLYVAVRGAFDIRKMLARLEAQRDEPTEVG